MPGWFVTTKPTERSRLASDWHSPDDYVASLSPGERAARIMVGEAQTRQNAYRDGVRAGMAGVRCLGAQETQPFTVQWRAGWRRGNADRARAVTVAVVGVEAQNPETRS